MDDPDLKPKNLKVRQRQSKKPAPCALSPVQAARIKVVRLLQIEAHSQKWVACGASDSFAFQPHGGPKGKNIHEVNLSMVLGEFKVIKVYSQWPMLQLKLSKSVNAVITAYKEAHSNPVS